MMISGMSHITFIVKHLEVASTFFEAIFEAEMVYLSGNQLFSISREKFFLIGEIWICIMEGEPSRQQTYDHIAFNVSDEELDAYCKRIQNLGVEIRPERPRVQGEGRSPFISMILTTISLNCTPAPFMNV